MPGTNYQVRWNDAWACRVLRLKISEQQTKEAAVSKTPLQVTGQASDHTLTDNIPNGAHATLLG